MTDEELSHFAVYDRASDYPGKVVVREWKVGAGKVWPMQECRLFDTVAEARAALRAQGLVNVGRRPEDDVALLEVWL